MTTVLSSLFPTDVDECATNNGGCDTMAYCLNTEGSYICRCMDGYVGDGTSCSECSCQNIFSPIFM